MNDKIPHFSPDPPAQPPVPFLVGGKRITGRLFFHLGGEFDLQGLKSTGRDPQIQ